MSQSVNFAFAHTVLPVLALWNKQKFYRDAFADDGKSYLTELWSKTATQVSTQAASANFPLPDLSLESMKRRLENRRNKHVDLGVHTAILDDMTEALQIVLPQPTRAGEPFSIAILASLQKRLFRKTVTEIRYFTLEPEDGPEGESLICEWKSPFPKPARVIHEKVTSRDPALFLSHVYRITRYRAPSAINSRGDVAGSVEKDEDGRTVITASRDADGSTLLFSLFLVMAESLPKNACAFLDWAGFSKPLNPKEREYFALAVMQHFHDAKANPDSVPPAIRECIANLPDASLPSLHRPLTAEVRLFFNSLFES